MPLASQAKNCAIERRSAVYLGYVSDELLLMKTRQVKQLAGLPKSKRQSLTVEGLQTIGANVARLAEELEHCNEASAYRAARLVNNVGREEAGKFLVLIDAYRSPTASQATLARQFWRAGDHLSKLLYAQIADYSIGSQGELIRAVASHRRSLYLDGPNDYDWIFRNELLSERESALYVDLVDSEGHLEWWAPVDWGMAISLSGSMRLVQALLETGLVSANGLDILSKAWTGFDPLTESHCGEWRERTARALCALPEINIDDSRLTTTAWYVADQWPMPLVELDVEEDSVKVDELVAQRQRLYEAEMIREYGDPADE